MNTVFFFFFLSSFSRIEKQQGNERSEGGWRGRVLTIRALWDVYWGVIWKVFSKNYCFGKCVYLSFEGCFPRLLDSSSHFASISQPQREEATSGIVENSREINLSCSFTCRIIKKLNGLLLLYLYVDRHWHCLNAIVMKRWQSSSGCKICRTPKSWKIYSNILWD